MQRTNVIELKPTEQQKSVLKEMMLLSSCVYNMANYEVRQAFFKKEKVPSFFKLQQMIQKKKDYQLLGRSYALPRIQIYGETNSARFKLIKSKTQQLVGLPKYLKNRKTNTTIPSYLVIDGCQYSIGKKKVTVPLSRQMREKYCLKRFDIKYNGVLRWSGKQQRGQVRFKNGKFYLYQSVEVKEVENASSSVSAGIDLGMKKLFAIVTSEGDECIIGSKRFFKQYNYYTGLIAQEQARLIATNKYVSAKLLRLYSRRTAYQDNLVNNVVAKSFRFLKRHKVSVVVVGDVKGIRRNNDEGAVNNSMLHNYWAYNKTQHKIKNKAEESGIRLVLTTEEYTSQECPCCYERNKPKDRIYVCDFCGFVEHRDVVGATNIMIKGMRDLLSERSAHQDETVHLPEVLA